MPVSKQYREFILQQLEAVGPVVCKNMFGGVGVYYDARFFAIVFNDALYFKVDARNRPEFEAEGMEPFKPFANRPMTMQYYEVPIHVIEDVEQLAEWARKALAAATPIQKKSRATKPAQTAQRTRRRT